MTGQKVTISTLRKHEQIVIRRPVAFGKLGMYAHPTGLDTFGGYFFLLAALFQLN
jgi:hypothetical protein